EGRTGSGARRINRKGPPPCHMADVEKGHHDPCRPTPPGGAPDQRKTPSQRRVAGMGPPEPAPLSRHEKAVALRIMSMGQGGFNPLAGIPGFFLAAPVGPYEGGHRLTWPSDGGVSGHLSRPSRLSGRGQVG